MKVAGDSRDKATTCGLLDGLINCFIRRSRQAPLSNSKQPLSCFSFDGNVFSWASEFQQCLAVEQHAASCRLTRDG